MHRSVILLALALVAAPSAYAMGSYNCIPCGEYGAYPVYVDGQTCPLCVRPSNYNCPGSSGIAVCCGGDTYIPCPTIACATSVSMAISGTGGCAIATSKMTALAQSQSVQKFDFPPLVYKTIIDDFCAAQDVQDYAVTTAAEKLAYAYAKAFAKAAYGWSAFVCTCVGCKGCPSAAYTALSANIASFAQAQAAAVATAIAETTACGDGWLVAAGADAEAFAQDTQTALLSVMKKFQSVGGSNCKLYYDAELERATAEALACAWVKVLINTRYTLNSNTWTYKVEACSNTLALTGSLVNGPVCPIKYCVYAP